MPSEQQPLAGDQEAPANEDGTRTINHERPGQDSSPAIRVREAMQPLIDALRFLTLLPLPDPAPASDQRNARAIPWFPAAGLVIGLLLLLPGWLAGIAWGPDVRTACVLVVWAILTSGLHLDGLGDTFDAVMSWRTRERKLEIMRDSRIGTMGLLAIGAVLLLKFAWLQAAGDAWWLALLLAPCLGRWAALYALYWFPPARAQGLGHSFQAHAARRAFLVPTVATLAGALLIGQASGLVAMGLVWVVSAMLARWWTRDLGGLTGDTYGALCEIGEVVALAAMSV